MMMTLFVVTRRYSVLVVPALIHAGFDRDNSFPPSLQSAHSHGSDSLADSMIVSTYIPWNYNIVLHSATVCSPYVDEYCELRFRFVLLVLPSRNLSLCFRWRALDKLR